MKNFTPFILILLIIMITCLLQPPILENLENNITTPVDKNDKYNCGPKLLNGKVDVLRTDVTSLNTRLDTLKKDVDKLEKEVGTNSEQLKFYRETIAQTQEEIAK